MGQPLTETQKRRLKKLGPQLDKAINKQDIESAKTIIQDLQGLLRPTGHFNKLSKAKNRLFELAIDLDSYSFAENGLLSNQQVLKENTRAYLETTALLAICYLRQQKIEQAKPMISEVLRNQKVIRTEHTRAKFNSAVIDRFNEEIALCTLRTSKPVDFDSIEIEEEVMKLIQKSDQEIFESIGQASPQATKDLLFMVYDYSTKQLTYKEKLQLPSPDQKIKDYSMGETIFQTTKRIIHNKLCDKDGDFQKFFAKNGMIKTINKGLIKSLILTTFVAIGIPFKLIAAGVIVMIMKLGIDVYCERYKPQSLMDLKA